MRIVMPQIKLNIIPILDAFLPQSLRQGKTDPSGVPLWGHFYWPTSDPPHLWPSWLSALLLL